MGLDITVLGKPLPGHEAEFHDLSIALSISNGVRQGDRPRPSFWKYLLGMAPPQISKTEIAAKTDRFNAISTPPYAVLGAPVVGQDAAADAWVRERAATAGKSPEQMLAEMAGYHVLQLLPDCDGLPAYSNGDMGYHVDQTSFRGAFLDLCINALPRTEAEAAWQMMTAPELLAYGQRLAEHAHRYALANGLVAQLGQRRVDWQDETSPQAQLHIVDSLARWAMFWGSRGHGAYPDF